MPPGDIAPVLLMLTLALITGAVLIFRGPLGRAIARRIEGAAGASPELEARINDLEQRVQDGDHERAELIERLEFAERLLLQAQEAPKEIRR